MKKDPNNKSTKENPVGRFMVAAGGVIELKKTGKILLIKRSGDLDWHPGEWEIGYGRIDQYEDVETGLRREIYEELGVRDIEIVKVTNVWHIYRGSRKAENELIGITFHCRTSTECVRLSKEHSQYCWVRPEEGIALVTNNGIKKDIEKFIFASKNN